MLFFFFFPLKKFHQMEDLSEENSPLNSHQKRRSVSSVKPGELVGSSLDDDVFAPSKKATESKGMDPRQKQILVMVLLDWLNFGMTIVVFPLLLLEQVFNGDVALASYWNGWIGGLQVVLMFLLGPIWGTKSDSIGRKPFLVMCCVASTCYYALNTIAFTHVVPGPTLWLVFGAAVIKGAFFMSQTFENAAVVDLSGAHERGAHLALNGAMLGIGLIGGSLVSVGMGALMHHAAPYLVASVLSAAMLVALVWWRETLKVDSRVPFSWREANPVSSLVWLMQTPLAWIPVSMYWMVNLIGASFLASWILWSNVKFNLDTMHQSLCIFDAGVAAALTQTIGMRMLMPVLGERLLIMSAIALKGLVCMGMILAPADHSVLTYFLLHSLSALFGVSMVSVPLIQALISHRVAPSEQGRLLAATESSRLTSEAVGQFGTTALFAFCFSLPKTSFFHTTDAHLWFAFFCVLICLAISFYGFYRHEEALFGHLSKAAAVEISMSDEENVTPSTTTTTSKKPRSVQSFFRSLVQPVFVRETLKIED